MKRDIGPPIINSAEVLRQHRGWILVFGIILMVLGALAIGVPMAAALAIELLLGWLLIVGSVFHGVHALRARRTSQFFWELLLCALYLAVGLIFLLDPQHGIITLTLLLAIFFILEGAFKLALAWQLRPLANWSWLMLSGVLALILGIIIWTGLPGTAGWVIGLLVGINLLFNGLSLVLLALAVKN